MFANLFTVYAGAQATQIVFENQLVAEGEKTTVAHVALSRADALALRDLLTKMLEP